MFRALDILVSQFSPKVSASRLVAHMAPGGKKEVKEERILFGRPSNNLKIGVVGLPNVGKSTFFNAITSSAVAAENYPFCTIAVPDARLDWLYENYKPHSPKYPAYLTVIDIAGLVKGASSGAGLGNAFLSHIKAVDAIFHVIRTFSDDSIAHVEGEVDSVRDIEIIHEELRLKDVEFLSKQLEGMRRALRGSDDKVKKFELETAEKALDCLSQKKRDIRHGEWTNKEIEVLNAFQLLSAKTVIYLANMSQEEYIKKKNKWLSKIKDWIDKHSPGDLLIPFSATFEHQLSVLGSQEDKEALQKELGATSALSKIILAGYSALQLGYYFTAGEDEKGTKAPQAAGVIHTDFEKGFIAAEIMKFEDLKAAGSETAVKASGKYLLKGKEHVVEDGDIIYFKFNTAGGSKKK